MNYNSAVMRTTDSTYGDVYGNVYKSNGSSLTLSCDRLVSSSDSSFTVTATLKDSNNSPIPSAVLRCECNNEVFDKATHSSGVCEFTIACDGSRKYDIRVSYTGTSSVSGCFATTSVYTIGAPETLTLQANHEIIQTGDSLDIVAVLTDDNGEGVPLATVNFYEEWTPGVRFSSEANIFQSGDTVDWGAQLIDTSDGSLVRKAGQTVNFYKELGGWTPPLDGTDNITSWTTGTNTTSNGEYTSHGSYLTSGWANEDIWTLSFDYKYSAATKKYVGLMPVCSSEINPFTDAKRADYAFATWEGSFPFYGLGAEYTVSPDDFTMPDQTEWNHIDIIKLTSTKLRVVFNSEYVWECTVPNLANLSTLHIGSRDNPSSRNAGDNVIYKNIEVR
jgi:hypothetical protein